MNRGIFGGGVYSVARGMQLRRVGDGKRVLTEISIQPVRGARRHKSGQIEYEPVAPFIPTSIKMPFHPGGNSLCFAIQLAHLMGAGQIHAVGFTLQSGSNYFFGRTNPIVKHGRPRATLYQTERVLAWCTWFEKMFPGRVLLDPSFSGPIDSVFRKATYDARQASTGSPPADDPGHQPDPHGVDADQG